MNNKRISNVYSERVTRKMLEDPKNRMIIERAQRHSARETDKAKYEAIKTSIKVVSKAIKKPK